MRFGDVNNRAFSTFAKRRFDDLRSISLSLSALSATAIFCPNLFSGLFGARTDGQTAARVLTRPICQRQPDRKREGERDTCVFARRRSVSLSSRSGTWP